MVNKKVLITAIVGVLFAGSAAATTFDASGKATPGASYGTEINLGTSASPTSFTGAPAQITWFSGYSYSAGEVRYVRIQASSNVVFAAAAVTQTAMGTGDTANASIGAVNGIGTNVITFSVTGGATTGTSGDAAFKLAATLNLTSAAASTVSVSLYDQPSEAQSGGTTGLIAGGSVSGPYVSFANSLAWTNTAETATADVEATPSFTAFMGGGTFAQLNTGVGIVSATPNTVAADGVTPLTPALLLAAGSTVAVSGDFSFIANKDGTFTAANVNGFGGAATKLTATTATFGALGGSTAFTVQGSRTAGWTPLIGAGTFTAHLNAVPATPASYNAPVLADALIGTIDHNGTELQAPLAQIPAGYISRLVLTNTGSVARPYTISVMGEAGSAVTGTTANLTGVVPANGTKVIDDLSTVFSGGSRATLNVNVAGPNNAIQGMYQIVNPASGSVSNTVLVRPGTN